MDPLGASTILESPSRTKAPGSGSAIISKRPATSSYQPAQTSSPLLSSSRLPASPLTEAAQNTRGQVPLVNGSSRTHDSNLANDPLGLSAYQSQRAPLSASTVDFRGPPRPPAKDEWKQNLAQSYHSGQSSSQQQHLQQSQANSLINGRPKQPSGFLPPTPRNPPNTQIPSLVSNLNSQTRTDHNSSHNGTPSGMPRADDGHARESNNHVTNDGLPPDSFPSWPSFPTNDDSPASQTFRSTPSQIPANPVFNQQPTHRNANVGRSTGDLDGRMTAEALRERDRSQGFVRIRMLGVDRAKKDLWLKLEASTNLSTYQHAHLKAISRSLAEFVSLHSALCANHPQVVVPALPIPATSAPSEEEEDRLLRNSFQRWFDRVTNRIELVLDDELRSFLEASFGYNATTLRRRLKPSSSYRLPLGKSKIIEDEDELGLIRSEMTRLEGIFGDVARAMDKAGQNRRSLSTALAELADQLSAFATTESHLPLSTGFRKTAEGVKRLGDVNAGLASAELVTLADALVYSAAEAKETKDALQQRQLIVDEHRTADKTAITKKRQIEKLRSSNSIKPERVDEALEDFEDAQRHEANLSAKLKAISQELAPSVKQHITEMHDDLFAAFLHHAKAGLLYERQNLKDLEHLKETIRGIPAKSANGVVYVHPSAPSLSSAGASVASQGPSEVAPPVASSSSMHERSDSMSSTHSSRALHQQQHAQRPSGGGLSQSMFVPPTHRPSAPLTSANTGSRINDLARSVVLSPTYSDNNDPLSGANGMHRTQSSNSSTNSNTKVMPVDEKRRVDAQMAASTLANAFF